MPGRWRRCGRLSRAAQAIGNHGRLASFAKNSGESLLAFWDPLRIVAWNDFLCIADQFGHVRNRYSLFEQYSDEGVPKAMRYGPLIERSGDRKPLFSFARHSSVIVRITVLSPTLNIRDPGALWRAFKRSTSQSGIHVRSCFLVLCIRRK